MKWSLSTEDNTVLLELEGLPGQGNRWMAFGFAPADAVDTQMVGSDVLIGE